MKRPFILFAILAAMLVVQALSFGYNTGKQAAYDRMSKDVEALHARVAAECLCFGHEADAWRP